MEPLTEELTIDITAALAEIEMLVVALGAAQESFRRDMLAILDDFTERMTRAIASILPEEG